MPKFNIGDFVRVVKNGHFTSVKGKVGIVRIVDIHDADLTYRVKIFDTDSAYLVGIGGWFSEHELGAANLRDDELVAYLLS